MNASQGKNEEDELLVIKEEQAKKALSLSRMVLPLLFGLAAAYWLFKKHFDPQQFASIRWDMRAVGWLFLAFLLLLFRHFCYTLRIRTLTGNVFDWLKSAMLIIIWEFSAALTPTSKGGPAVMLFVLIREGVKPGRATSAILYTMLLDSSFFVISLPIWLFIYGERVITPDSSAFAMQGLAEGTFRVVFAMMSGMVIGLFVFLFVRPKIGEQLMLGLSRIPFLKRWKAKLEHIGHDFVESAAQLRSESAGFHFKAIFGTVGAWTSKFVMINCIILAIAPQVALDGGTQLFVYARLVAMFIVMAFSPTPGGAGLAELALAAFLSDIIPQSLGMVVALIWRGMAYYAYLIAGAMAVSWYFGKKKK